MNAIKFFHHLKWPYWIIVSLCLFYSLFGFYKLVVETKTPFKIKAEGIILDPEREYHFTNYESVESLNKKSDDTHVLIRYIKNKEWMPNYLGTLYYGQEWKLNLNNAILDPNTRRNPFLPYSRSTRKTANQEFVFFNSEEVVPEDELKAGLIFNYPTGSVKDREYLQIKEISGQEILYFEDDGVGVSYKLPDFQTDISVVFNSDINGSNTKGNLVFSFEDISSDIKKIYSINYVPKNFLWASVEIKDDLGDIIFEKSGVTNTTFAVENILFSLKINQKYGIATIFLFLLHIALITAFTFYLIQVNRPAYNNPIQSSIVKTRIIMNCLILLGSALFIKTFGYYKNSISYDATLLLFPHLFNLSYFFVPYWKKLSILGFSRFKLPAKYFKWQGFRNIIFAVCIGIFFVLIPIAIGVSHIVSNERVLGIPALHFQKLLIILAYFAFSSELISNQTSRLLKSITPNVVEKYFDLPLPKNILILLFSFIISLITGDFGSILFVAIAIIMIEITIRRIDLKSVLFKFGIVVLFLLVINQLGFFDDRKLYRLLYSFLPPYSESFSHFNQADRESISYIWFNLKSFFESLHLGLFNDLKILEVSKSVAHSDYAFHWSLMLGGTPFFVLLLLCLLFLLTHLIFVFRSTLIPMKIGKYTFLGLPKNKYTIIISFWLAITIIQFVYQLFSNNMLLGSILSGIPMPFISVGRGDYIFIGILIVGLEILFYSNSFKADSSAEKIKFASCNQVFNSSHKLTLYLILVVLFLIGIKGLQFHLFNKENIKIFSIVDDDKKQQLPYISSYSFDPSSQQEYIELAEREIADADLTNLPIKIKKRVQPLQYAYFNAEPYKTLKRVPFQLSQKRLKERISWSNHYLFNQTIISGEHSPFGIVHAKKVLVNDRFIGVISHPYYSYLNLNSSYLNYDLSAELNRLLESHIQRISNHAKASILILDNTVNEYIVTSQYPNNPDGLVYFENYFIGSVKKVLLLDAALSINYNKYTNFTINGLTLENWIKYSNYKYAGILLEDILLNSFEEFDDYLFEEYNLPFYSFSVPSYSDRPESELTNVPLLANGGMQKYPLSNVLQWFRQLILKTNNKDKEAIALKNILNLPLHSNGTASVVGQNLQQSNIDVSQFIAKTGTLEENGKNISSTFIISNHQYTIGIMIAGENLPNNSSGLTAKYVFANDVIPLLKKYSILTK